jgi:raffinose/stachyose/melibiose transport system substrate-binding protein
MKLLTLTTLGALAGILAATVPAAAQTQLTMWKYGDCPPDACMEQALIDAFEAKNPDIKIEFLTQPPDGYFTSLQAASAIGRGPDIAVMWAGSYMNQFQDYMVDLHKYVADDIVASTNGANYFSKDGDTANALYVAPMSIQWYIGWYNKKLFADAGITDVPRTWDELTAAAEKLKAAGIQPIIQGAAGGSAQFQPLFEWAYLAAGLPVSDWGKILSGEMPYNNPTLTAQLDKWHALYEAGYINEDAFNYPGTIDDFKAGKAAMLLGGGSWQVAELEQGLGADLGALVPPYSDDPQDSLVALAGYGYAVMNYSQHQDEAGKFAAFILSDEGQKIIATYDAPPRAGFPTTREQLNDLIAKSADPAWHVYPMFDNFTHPSVADASYRNAAQVLVGQETAADALSAIDAAQASIPADQKGTKFTFAD